jgi:hypothetical protein
VLLTELLHPEMLSALAAADHGGRVLIADGPYPGSTAVGPHARTVHLNLVPGCAGCIDRAGRGLACRSCGVRYGHGAAA